VLLCPKQVLASQSVSDREEAATAAGRIEAEELLEIEEADAWFEYLESIRSLPSREQRYAEVEPWAWARLAVRLRTIRTRRSKLKAA
jgi:hypothetical protein